MNEAFKAGMKALREHMAREVEKAPVPPGDVLARTITRRDVQQYDVYFIWGPGRDITSRTDCGHGYYLTDSCPCCDADDDTET
ncbi:MULTISPECIES: hypothetical protein [unclassified Amycolatopsis]|uniref:hypothetical protein n=1 Tax=unclassified Amycolatopsis TaxID=2618356 RepID=UPI00106E5955|nr:MULTISPECIES: hypothetical protein [unclassified Amycolatopsis]